MKKFKDILGEAISHRIPPKKVKVSYRVWPIAMKPRNYKNLNDMVKDFTEGELEDAAISVVMNSVVVGNLDIDKVLDEIF